MNTVYVGAELKAQEMLFMSVINVLLAVILATYAVISARQRARDLLLLEYIDKDAARSQAKRS